MTLVHYSLHLKINLVITEISPFAHVDLIKVLQCSSPRHFSRQHLTPLSFATYSDENE